MNETTPPTAALPGKEAETAYTDYRTNGEREECEAAGIDHITEDQYEEEGDDDDDEDFTDDEEDIFFGQLDSNPHKMHRKDSYKEPMVPFECSDPEEALQHFVQVFEERYGELHPHFYIGSIENAIKEVTDVQDPQTLKPLLMFIHSDKSIMAHIFCSEVLCSQPVVDYLNANYIVWPWDITYQGNKNILLTMVEDSFSKDSLTDDLDDSFETHPSYLKRARSSATAHVTPKSVLQQLVSQVDDLPACLVFYPVGGQPHSIQGTWLAGKSCDNMLNSFLTTLVSSVENYKFLLIQNPNSPEARKIYEILQEQHHEKCHFWPPPSRHQPLSDPVRQVLPVSSPVNRVPPGSGPFSQVPPVSGPVSQVPPISSPVSQVLPDSGPVSQVPPVSHNQVCKDDPPVGQELPGVGEDLGTPVDPKESGAKVDGVSEDTEATKDAQDQETPEDQNLQLKPPNTDPSIHE